MILCTLLCMRTYLADLWDAPPAAEAICDNTLNLTKQALVLQ
jgi:hypothetical protein